MSDTVKRYHSGAIVLHWLMALLIFGNLALGLLLEDIPVAERFQYYQLHKSFGIAVLVLAVLRIIWRFMHPAPSLPSHMATWEKAVAHITHFVLYVLMVFIPFSGWALVSSSPKKIPTLLFGVVELPHLPFFDGLSDDARKEVSHNIAETHELLAYILLALLGAHILAAIRHHWLLKDETILRITPGWAEGLLNKLRGKSV